MSGMIGSVLDASVDDGSTSHVLADRAYDLEENLRIEKTSERVLVLDRIITGLDPMAVADRAGRRLLHYYSVRNLGIFAIRVATWMRSDTRVRSRSCDHTYRRKMTRRRRRWIGYQFLEDSAIRSVHEHARACSRVHVQRRGRRRSFFDGAAE
jgi:hypothetical protein